MYIKHLLTADAVKILGNYNSLENISIRVGKKLQYTLICHTENFLPVFFCVTGCHVLPPEEVLPKVTKVTLWIFEMLLI